MPPLVGVAVNVTAVPEQVGLEPEVIAMDTEGVAWLVMLSEIALLVAVEEVTQLILVVMMQVMLPPAVAGSV